MLDRLKARYRRLPDQWKATLRHAWQVFSGVVIIQVLTVLNTLRGAVLGETSADLAGVLLDSARLSLAAAIGACSLIVTFVMNRGTHGARYPNGGE